MRGRGKVARRSGYCDRAGSHECRPAFWSTRDDCTTDYVRGALVAGLIVAFTFGLAMVHAAVAL